MKNPTSRLASASCSTSTAGRWSANQAGKICWSATTAATDNAGQGQTVRLVQRIVVMISKSILQPAEIISYRAHEISLAHRGLDVQCPGQPNNLFCSFLISYNQK